MYCGTSFEFTLNYCVCLIGYFKCFLPPFKFSQSRASAVISHSHPMRKYSMFARVIVTLNACIHFYQSLFVWLIALTFCINECVLLCVFAAARICLSRFVKDLKSSE